MLAAACVGTNDLENVDLFYDKVLATVGMRRCFGNGVEIAYSNVDGGLTFQVLTLFDGKSASFGNGSQLIFSAKNQASVDAFYQAVL